MLIKSLLSVTNVSIVPAVAGLHYFVGVPAVACSCCCCFNVFLSAIVSSLAGVSAMTAVP